VILFALVLMVGVLWDVGLFGKGSGKLDELSNVLGKTARYCQSLRNAAFHFVCDETIVETIAKRRQNFEKSRRYPWHRNRTEINSQYQIIKEGDKIEEYRVKRSSDSRVAVFSFQNALVPLYLFSAGNQGRFNYQILKKENILKRKAFKIEIRLKGEGRPEALAYAWVDCKDYSVLKTEFFPKAFKGYRHLQDLDKRNIENLKIDDTHYFGYQRNGLRFPSKTDIRISYSGKYLAKRSRTRRTFRPRSPMPTQLDIRTKIKTTYNYTNYKFFTAQTADPTIVYSS
jgi:hypothetical protein